VTQAEGSPRAFRLSAPPGYEYKIARPNKNPG